MDEMEVVVRVGFVPGGLLARALVVVVVAGPFVEPERLCLPAKGGFLTPSETEARGRVAVEDDLTDATELAGDTTERAAVACFEADDAAGLDEGEEDGGGFDVEEDRGGLEVEEDMDVFEVGGTADLDGTTEARRAGPLGVPVDGALATGVGLVGLEAGAPALTDFLRAEVAEEALLAMEDTVSETTLEAGAFFTAPTPNVPELRIYDQTVKAMTKFNVEDLPS
jgi:hypothetical protein